MGANARIQALNLRIKQLAVEFNLGPVVDLYSLFESNPQLLGMDGLHPSAQGQTRIAEAFAEEIVVVDVPIVVPSTDSVKVLPDFVNRM